MRLQVQSPALLSGLEIRRCRDCGVGSRRSSDPSLLWLWRRPAATARIWPLAWEPPNATGAALEKDKRQKTKKKKKNFLLELSIRLKKKIYNLYIHQLQVLLVVCYKARVSYDWGPLINLWTRLKECNTKSDKSILRSYLQSNKNRDSSLLTLWGAIYVRNLLEHTHRQ